MQPLIKCRQKDILKETDIHSNKTMYKLHEIPLLPIYFKTHKQKLEKKTQLQIKLKKSVFCPFFNRYIMLYQNIS